MTMLREPRTLKRGSTAGGSATLEILPVIAVRVVATGEVTTISAIVPLREWWYCEYLFNGECYEVNEAELDEDAPGWRELLVNARLERI